MIWTLILVLFIILSIYFCRTNALFGLCFMLLAIFIFIYYSSTDILSKYYTTIGGNKYNTIGGDNTNDENKNMAISEPDDSVMFMNMA